MRSRYSAYALGGHGDYLLATWLPSVTKGLTSVELSVRAVDWVGMEIVSKSQQGEHGQVEFNAFYLADDGKQEVLHENSVFKRICGRWYYVGGEVT